MYLSAAERVMHCGRAILCMGDHTNTEELDLHIMWADSMGFPKSRAISR